MHDLCDGFVKKLLTKPLNVFTPSDKHEQTIWNSHRGKYFYSYTCWVFAGNWALSWNSFLWCEKMLRVDATSLPVCPLQTWHCLPPFASCGSWTLLTQLWPWSIVSPYSSSKDPTLSCFHKGRCSFHSSKLLSRSLCATLLSIRSVKSLLLH